jgi:hypothetical protein
VASARHHNGLPERFLADSLDLGSTLSPHREPAEITVWPRHCGQTAFEIMSFNLQDSD